MADKTKLEIKEAIDRYMGELISWASGFPDKEKTYIESALLLYIKMVIYNGINRVHLFKRLEIIKAPVKDGYGMCQPLIDGEGGIRAYRIYISDAYNFNAKQLQEVFLHEMLHTMSRTNILKHKTFLYHGCYNYLKRTYDMDVFNIGKVEEIDGSKREISNQYQ